MRRLAALLLVALSAFGAGRALAPSGSGPTANFTFAATSAYARGRFLTVWQESMGLLGAPIMGILHDANGRRISTRAFPLLQRAASVHVVASSEAFALFWDDDVHSYLTEVDRNGTVRGTTKIDVKITAAAKIAWNGTRFLVLNTTYAPQTNVTLLASDGTIVATLPALPDTVWTASAAPALRGFTIATYETAGMCVRRVSNAGALEWMTCVEPAVFDANAPVSTAVDDRGALVAWSSMDGAVRATVIRDGVAGPIRTLATAAKPLRPLHLGAAGNRFLLAFAARQEWDAPVSTLVLDATGAAQMDARATQASSYSFSAASSGTATLATFGDLVTRSELVVIANNGTSGPPEDLAIGGGVQSQPALADMGSHLLAAWSDAFADEAELTVSALNPNDEQFWELPLTNGRLASTELPSNGAEAMVLSEREVGTATKLQATLVDRNGNQHDTLLLGDTSDDWPVRDAAAVWTGAQWVVMWSNPTKLDLDVAVVRDHALVSSQRFSPPTPVAEHWGRTFAHLAFARNATTTLFVWTEQHDLICAVEPPCGISRFHTYAARMNADGTLSGPPLELPSGARSLSVATSGDEFVVLAGNTATILDAGARRILRSFEVFGWDGAAGDITWTGSDYAVALRYQLVKWYLNVTHLDREGNVTGTAKGIETLAARRVIAPSIARSLIALQEGDWMLGTRAVIYEESQLAPLPPPPSHPMPRIVPDGAGWYDVTWDPVPGAELYAIELPEDAVWWTDSVVVQAGGRLYANVPTASVRVIAVGPGGTSEPPPRRRAARR